MDDLYDFGNSQNPKFEGGFNFKLLEKHLNTWMNLKFFSDEKERECQYSDQLKFAILGMCRINTENRFTSKQVYEWLKIHEVDIVNLQPFTVTMPNFKSDKELKRVFSNTKKIGV